MILNFNLNKLKMDCANSDLKKLIAKSEVLDILIFSLAKIYESVYSELDQECKANNKNPDAYKALLYKCIEETDSKKIKDLEYTFDDLSYLVYRALPEKRLQDVRNKEYCLKQKREEQEKYLMEREEELLKATMEFTRFKNETSKELIKFFNGKAKNI